MTLDEKLINYYLILLSSIKGSGLSINKLVVNTKVVIIIPCEQV